MDETPDTTQGYSDPRPPLYQHDRRPCVLTDGGERIDVRQRDGVDGRTPHDGRTPPLVTANEGGEGGVPTPQTEKKAFQGASGAFEGPNLGLRKAHDGRTLPSEVKVVARALANPEVVVPPEVAEGLVPLFWDVAHAENATNKDKVSAGRAIVLALEYNRRLRKDAQEDQQHLERLAAGAAKSSLDDPEVRKAMAAARARRLAPPDQQPKE